MNIISIDIETTGLDPQKHNILSIGAVNPINGEEFYRELYYKDLCVCAETGSLFKIHFNKIQQLKDCQKSQPYLVVCDFNTWLIGQFNYKPITAIGFNIGSFDMQFIKQLACSVGSPGTMDLFNYRFLDLNSVMMFLTKKYITTSFSDFKELNNSRATDLLKQKCPQIYELGAHNALYDAWFNVCYWEILLDYYK